MTDGMVAGMAGMGILVWLLGLFLLILWVALPFAVFGIKGRLDEIIKQLKKLNAANDKETKT